MKIKKHIIANDSAQSREEVTSLNHEYTLRRFARFKEADFKTSTMIYDNKTSIITLAQTGIIGIIIEDPHIYKTQKDIFDLLWENLGEQDHSKTA